MENVVAGQGEILLYSDGSDKEYVSVIFAEENFWLSQKGLAELLDCTPENIIQHLKKIFVLNVLYHAGARPASTARINRRRAAYR